MGPKGKNPMTGDLFRQPLVELINEKHPLVRLAELIDWSIFKMRWSAFFPSKTGRPATPPRLVAGLLYLQHTFACSDEETGDSTDGLCGVIDADLMMLNALQLFERTFGRQIAIGSGKTLTHDAIEDQSDEAQTGYALMRSGKR